MKVGGAKNDVGGKVYKKKQQGPMPNGHERLPNQKKIKTKLMIAEEIERRQRLYGRSQKQQSKKYGSQGKVTLDGIVIT